MNNSKNYANANLELKLQILFAFLLINYSFIKNRKVNIVPIMSNPKQPQS